MASMLAGAPKKLVGVVVAATPKGGIGMGGTLPWTLKGDMAYFVKVTTSVAKPGLRNAIIMGRKTWESIPKKVRPLKNRLNIVLTSSADNVKDAANPNLLVVTSVEAALKQAKDDETVESIYLIGGAGLIKDMYSSPECDRVHLTKVLKDFECDVFIPELDHTAWAPSAEFPVEKHEEDGVPFEFHVYDRI